MASKRAPVEQADLPKRPGTTADAAEWEAYASLLETMLTTGEPLEEDPREIAKAIQAG